MPEATRGHGDSDKPEHGYRLEDQAADVAAFMDAVDVDAAVIVGHSMGSYIAQRFAIDHPERTIGLVLMGTFRIIAGDPGLTEFRAELEQLEDPLISPRGPRRPRLAAAR
jgi:pimeloyl-ACP methyl ester carboxylesterase